MHPAHPTCTLQDHLLPSEYVVCMREHMLDRCPVSTYEQVCGAPGSCAGRQLSALKPNAAQRGVRWPAGGSLLHVGQLGATWGPANQRGG